MQNRIRALGILGFFVVALVAIAGCGGGDDSSNSGATTGGETSASSGTADAVKKAEADLVEPYEGVSLEMPTSSPKAAKDKNVWLIDCPLAITSCAEIADGFKTATAAVGWNGDILDDQFNPQVAAQLLERAVAAKVDGILTGAVDCGTVKSALEQVQAANIPVFSITSEDCDPPLYTALNTVAGLPWNEGQAKTYVPGRAAWGVVATKGEMKVIDIALTDVVATKMQDEGFREYIEGCPECEIVETVNLTSATLETTQQQVAAALTAHPEANAIWVYDGAAYPSGVKQAVDQAGRKDLVLIGGECTGGEIQMIHEGYNTGCYGYEVPQASWQAIDWMNRMINGESAEDLPQTGIALKMIDKEHNLPAGNKFIPPVDYQATYKELWGIE